MSDGVACPYGDKCPIIGGPRSPCAYCGDGNDRAHAEELRQMLEALWRSPRVVNPRRRARYEKPMKFGATWGSKDDVFGF
jgi:hypothetical protein